MKRSRGSQAQADEPSEYSLSGSSGDSDHDSNYDSPSSDAGESCDSTDLSEFEPAKKATKTRKNTSVKKRTTAEEKLKAKMEKAAAKRAAGGWVHSGTTFVPPCPDQPRNTKSCGPRWSLILQDINEFVVPKIAAVTKDPQERRQISATPITTQNLTSLHLYLLFMDGRISIVDHLMNSSIGDYLENRIPRATVWSYLAARIGQQLTNRTTKEDGWSKKTFEFAAGTISTIITKNDYYSCQKNLKIDIKFLVDTCYSLCSRYWLPFPHLCLDDKADNYKGKHFCKTFRQRKPKPWCLIGYCICDETAFRICWIPRFPPWATKSAKYLKWIEQWSDYESDKEKYPRPLPLKKAFGTNATKSEFDLPVTILELLSFLPVGKDGSCPKIEDMKNCNWSYYDITLDREFGTAEIISILKELPGLGFIVGYQAQYLAHVFTDHLHLGLKKQFGCWNTICTKTEMALSYSSSEICNFISNQYKNSFSEQNGQRIPDMVNGFRERMRFVDTHDQHANGLAYPFPVHKACDRLFNSVDRSLQVNCQIIFNFLRKQPVTSKRFLEDLLLSLSEPYRTVKGWGAPRGIRSGILTHNPKTHECLRSPENTKVCRFCKKGIPKFVCKQCAYVPLHAQTGGENSCWHQFKKGMKPRIDFDIH